MGRASHLRRRVYQVLDVGFAGDRLCQIVHWLLIGLVLINVATVVAESVPSIRAQFHWHFVVIEVISGVLFTLEYLARLWVAVEHGPLQDQPAWKARLMHAFSPGMLIDVLAIVPFVMMLSVEADLRFLLLLRLMRFFKIARYSTGMRSLLDAMYAERHALGACIGILGGLVLMSASLMHLVEHDAQPDKFGTIPDAMYWAIITLATVGYGDVVPITPIGKVVAACTAIFGLVMVALPVGILATAFSEVIHRRDFVVTWGMVARVPLFQGLDAETIAELMRFLRSQMAQPGQIIVRKGETAKSMYFIAAGAVEVEIPGRNVTLGVGEFFGEIALLGHARRTATVRAVDRVSLLALDAGDVQGLMERRPDVAERINAIAKARLGAAVNFDHGDLIDDELKRPPSA